MNGFVLTRQALQVGWKVQLWYGKKLLQEGFVCFEDSKGAGGCQQVKVYAKDPENPPRGELLTLFLIDGDWRMRSPGGEPGERTVDEQGPRYQIEVVSPPAQFVEIAPAVEVTEVTPESLRGKPPDFDLGI